MLISGLKKNPHLIFLQMLNINTQKNKTYCGGRGYSVRGNNWCNSGCSHWCDRAEDGLLWGAEIKNTDLHHCTEWLFIAADDTYQEALTCVMVCAGCGFWAPIAGWDGSVIRVAVSRAVWDLWMLTAAGGGWIVRPGRLKKHTVLKSKIRTKDNRLEIFSFQYET